MLLEKLIIKKNIEINLLKSKLISRETVDKNLIKKRIKYIMDDLNMIIEEYQNKRIREFTLQEVAKYDGKDGRLAYIVINGTVYDVTEVEGFKDGQHYGVKAGSDATEKLYECHKNQGDILKKLRVVGVLKQ